VFATCATTQPSSCCCDVSHCVTGALAAGDPIAAEQKGRELLEAVQRFTRTG
jgi:hypothetical protein